METKNNFSRCMQLSFDVIHQEEFKWSFFSCNWEIEKVNENVMKTSNRNIVHLFTELFVTWDWKLQ